MKQVIATLTLALLMAGSAHAFPVGPSVPPESFLDYHVDTVPQLSFEVAYDAAVRARLARHFHLSGPAMSQYVAKHLVLIHLKAPLRTRVYCILPGGRESYVEMTLRKGAAVFATPDGKPVLRLECGNPLVRVLPKPPLMASLTNTGVKSAVQSSLEQQIMPSAAAPIELNTTGLTASSLPVIAGVGPGQVLFTAAGASGSALGWIPALGGIFAVVATSGHSPSSPTTPVTPNTPTTPSGPSPVPEPSPALVMALGGLGLLAAARLRHARRAN